MANTDITFVTCSREITEKVGIAAIVVGVLHVATHLFTYWNVNVNSFIAYQKKQYVKECDFIKVKMSSIFHEVESNLYPNLHC